MSQRRKLGCVAVVIFVWVFVVFWRRFALVADVRTFVKYYLLMACPWADDVQQVLTAQRGLLAQEMVGYHYPAGRYNVSATSLADLVPELGGQPFRSLVISSWRSGSTFLGEILNSHPANLYHFEPLRYFAGLQIRSQVVGDVAVKDLRALLTCQYSELGHILEHASRARGLLYTSLNTRLWQQCHLHPRLCWLPEFMTPFCRLFPFVSMKTVRLRLRFAEKLLSDPGLNVRVIYLVRDPRGTLRSRNNLLFWCSRNPDCISPDRLCLDLESDFDAAERLAVKYPHTFRAVRYEELAVDPFKRSRDLFAFLGLDFHPKVREYLSTHTTVGLTGGALNTYQESKKTPFAWQREMAYQDVEAIQGVCGRAMQRWGYRLAHNHSHQTTFSPVGRLTLY